MHVHQKMRAHDDTTPMASIPLNTGDELIWFSSRRAGGDRVYPRRRCYSVRHEMHPRSFEIQRDTITAAIGESGNGGGVGGSRQSQSPSPSGFGAPNPRTRSGRSAKERA